MGVDVVIGLSRVRALLANPQLRGEWYANGCYVYRTSEPFDRRQVARVPTIEPGNGGKHPIADFIASARVILPRALDHIGELERELEAAARWIESTQFRVGDDEHKRFAVHLRSTLTSEWCAP